MSATTVTETGATGAKGPTAEPDAPPGPRGLASIAAAVDFARDPWMAPQRLARRYGDVVALPLPFADVVLLSHPDHLAHVAVKHPERYKRSDWVTENMKPIGANVRFFAFETDDAAWSRGRKLLQPHFTQKALVELGRLFTEAITEQVGGWQVFADRGEPVDLQDQLKALTLSVLMNSMFSHRVQHDEMQRLARQLKVGMEGATVRTLLWWLPRWVPRPLSRRYASVEQDLDRYLDAMIARRRAQPIDTADVLGTLLAARYEDGEPLEDEKLRAEMTGMVVGGFETTAAALTWSFALLTTHRNVEERLRAEVDALAGAPVTPAHMDELPFVRACFDEAQRLQGGLVINPKVAAVDDEIGGYRIAAGTTVVNSNITLHRDPRFWSDPDRYDPERWLRDDVPREAYWPFGRGSRMCLGMRMAYIEAVLTLASAYQRYDFALPPGYKLRPQYRMSMGLKGGLPMTLSPRA